MTEAAYTTLRQDILSGRIQGNTLWSDRELAQAMNLSRTPVREAVQRLAVEGLVEVIPRRGTRVLPLREGDVREIHQIAKALELEAALLLAQAETRDLGPLGSAVADMDAALAAEDREAWAEADTRFHLGIVDLCGNRRLSELYHGHRTLTDRARYFALHLRSLPQQSADDHRRMLAAIEARDTDALARIYHAHWTRTTEELLALLRRHALAPPIDTAPREERE